MRSDVMAGGDFPGRLFVHAMPMLNADNGVCITQGAQRTPLAVVVDRSMGRPLPVGSIEPVGGMWKNARMTLSTDRGLVVAVGMADIMSALHRASPQHEPSVVLPLHDGYLGIYGLDGKVKARILENRQTGIWEYRLFDPHEARSFPSLSLALDHALGLE